MAPLQQLTAASSLVRKPYDGFIEKRGAFQGIDSTDSHTQAVMFVSLSFSAISVVAALVSFYWFVRMRKGFRQDMIMLLIQSDMAKALWLLISPLVYFITDKPLGHSRAFCQVSGFFLAASIEASDIAALLIAVHTTLFVVKRQNPGTTFGLQPYRRVAYTLWATVPIILAAIVPITGNSFVDNGPYCYLPVRPGWYRETLAWIPRYIIFGVIIITYTALYLYVYMRFRRFGEDQRRASTLNSVSTGLSTRRHPRGKWRSRSVPPTPHLTTHGLLDSHSTHVSMRKNDQEKLRQSSVASTVSTLHIGDGGYLPEVPERVVRKSSIAWDLVAFGQHDGPVTQASITPCSDTDLSSPTAEFFPQQSHDANQENQSRINNMADTVTAGIAVPKPAYGANTRNENPSPSSSSSSSSSSAPSNDLAENRHSRWKRRLRPRSSADLRPRNSVASIIATLRQGPPRRSAQSTTKATRKRHLSEGEMNNTPGDEEEEEEEIVIISSSSSVHLPTEESEESMRRSRDRMKRQMRLLFVYPAIYLLTWIAPFVAHAYSYQDQYGTTVSHTVPNNTLSNNSTLTSPILDPSQDFPHYLLSLATAAASTSSASSAPSSSLAAFPLQPLPLRIISMASLCIAAAADCAFFSAWERPWRHLRGGFWANMAKRLRVHRLLQGRLGSLVFAQGGGGGFAGRSRDERVADERVARRRREREREMGLALRCKMGSNTSGRAGSSSSTAGKSEGEVDVAGEGGDVKEENMESQGKKRREWWDSLDEEGAL
ncbi:G protein-coupled glucose receptor regulating Gpa2-domain-containing protein [Xylaria venustula]|nr:G protein-coupled glucose receptor regulating Gpa2-domain-containing protein [Xylaria venustula]